jgi:hypothetical protein
MTAAWYLIVALSDQAWSPPRNLNLVYVVLVPKLLLLLFVLTIVSCSYWQHRRNEGLQPSLEQLIRNANATWVLGRCKRVLDHVFDI